MLKLKKFLKEIYMRSCYEFKPEKSNRATYLQSLTDEQLFDRYYTYNDHKSNFFKDALTQVRRGEVDQVKYTVTYQYPWLRQLEGTPYNYIFNRISNEMEVPISSIMPEYKLNAEAIASDLEAILSEKNNLVYTVKAREKRDQKIQTYFIAELVDFILDLINRGYKFKSDEILHVE